MSLMISDRVVATIHYKLTDNDGEVLDSSEGAEPLSYLHGAGNLIPGLERELHGKEEGAALQVQVTPADAYGEVQQELIEVLPLTAFEGVASVEPGMAFEAQSADGQARRIVVTAVDGDEVTVDGNHPLAGVELNFDVKVVEVREASEEELEHGHVH